MLEDNCDLDGGSRDVLDPQYQDSIEGDSDSLDDNCSIVPRCRVVALSGPQLIRDSWSAFGGVGDKSAVAHKAAATDSSAAPAASHTPAHLA
ncbi:unnamed protein product [Arctia plantaginis]|uniref:Uncharacterized protein n=1 Tax=Arctia plantaginis TaxID=874455 RepID=A0A8S0ZQE9_ARCPL|nr:unnamed protein product [Arctia plantaginis]